MIGGVHHPPSKPSPRIEGWWRLQWICVIWAYFGTNNSSIRVFLKRDIPKKKKKREEKGPCQADRRNHDRIGFYHEVIWGYFGPKNSNIRVFLKRDMPQIKKNKKGPCQADRRDHDRIGFYHKVIWAYFGTKNINIRVFLKRDMPQIKKKPCQADRRNRLRACRKNHTFTENWFFQLSFPDFFKAKKVVSKLPNTLSIGSFNFPRKINWFWRGLPKNTNFTVFFNQLFPITKPRKDVFFLKRGMFFWKKKEPLLGMHETSTEERVFWKKRAPARQTPGIVSELGFYQKSKKSPNWCLNS